jgi:hypothetical protein
MITRLYKGCYERVYVWSPSIDLDSTWLAVKKYSEESLGVDQSKEKTFFSHWDEADMERVVAQHAAVAELCKRRKMHQIPAVLIIVDDFADMKSCMHSSNNALARLFLRGRHQAISTIVSSQKLTCLDPVLRTQATFMIIGKLRNGKEKAALFEELSALHAPAVLDEMYEKATAERFSFLYINLMAHPPKFYIRFDGGEMVPEDFDDDTQSKDQKNGSVSNKGQ